MNHYRGTQCVIGFLRLLVWFTVVNLMALMLLKSVCAADHEPLAEFKRTLADKLQSLSVKHGFLIKGLEKTSATPARPVRGEDLQEQLRRLLFDFNHVLLRSPDGEVERVLILSQKEPAPTVPESIVLNTGRRGDHHVVQARIQGSGRTSIEVALLVDTGSSFVVLPASMLSQLGFTPEELEDHQIQTANGQMRAKIGQLRSLEMGPERLQDVAAAFIDDHLLGSHGLLGMNVLGRYLVTIDDQKNLITLIKSN